MRNLASKQQEDLLSMFGNRANLDPHERQFYSSDVGTMPRMMRPMIGKSLPAGIVQPISEDELIRLARWASENRIPLVPRGKATSGYGGVMPVDGGIVVEFNRMRDILSIDDDRLEVTVQPGAVWEKVEQELNSHGLTLKSYPTSAPSSTVAGWLATGGAGVGSYQAGYFRENVVSVRMVAPDGEVLTLSGEGLDLVENASGVTGFITSVTFRVDRAVPIEKMALGFSDADKLAHFVSRVFARELPLWSMSFINPEVAVYRNRMPARQHHGGGHCALGDVRLPEDRYTVLLVFDARASLQKTILELAAESGAQDLGKDLAEHEWQERFNPMKAKRISPSLVPAEVIVPADNLARVLSDLKAKIRLPFLLEGFTVKGGEVVLLGFIPHDERKFGFNVAFGLSLTVLKTALSHGGRPYGGGLYFSKYASSLIGDKALATIRQFKRVHDTGRIMNPGKMTDNRMIASLISAALPLESLIRGTANHFPGNPAGEFFTAYTEMPEDVAWYAYSCAQCGYCVDECDQYYGRGWESQSPRGKWRLLKMVADGDAVITQQDVRTFIACTTCEICNERCQLDLPVEPSWLKLRGQLVNDEGFHTLPAFHIMAASARKEKNIWAGYAKDRDGWVPDDIKDYIKDKAQYAYFPGCTASFVEKDIAVSTARLLKEAGVEYTYLGKDEACCGIPMLMAGKWDVFEEIMDHNIRAMKKHGATTVITSCPACRLIWDTYYKRWTLDKGEDYPFVAKHYSEVIAEKIADGSFKPKNELSGTVTYHDPCHMGRASGIYEEPRELIKAIPGIEFVEMKNNRDKAHCCGSVMTLVDDPDIGAVVGKVRVDEALETGADTIITACPCCRVQLQATADYYGMDTIKVRDLSTLVAEACGMEVVDSTPEINASWAIFDAMIRMMTPAGMADMMAEMLPEMIDAMPAPMGGMMKWMRSLPAWAKKPMVGMMKPMMPRLFPILLPGMMPKIMPQMLDLVNEKIAMPDHMKEQLPDLMPPAMDELMPKMLPEIIPHFMPYMVKYLMAA